MVMIFTIVSAVQEFLNQTRDDMILAIKEEKEKKEREIREAEEVLDCGVKWLHFDLLNHFQSVFLLVI